MEAYYRPNPISHTIERRNQMHNFSSVLLIVKGTQTHQIKASPNRISFLSDKLANNSGLLDSCELIAKSRGAILGIVDSKFNIQQPISPGNNKTSEMVVCSQRRLSGFNTGMSRSKRITEYSTSQKEKYLGKILEYAGSRKQLNTVLGRNSESTHYTDNEIERFTVGEIGNDTLRRTEFTNSLKISKAKGKPPLINPLYALRKEVIERKQRMSQYKIEILKTLEDEKDDSLTDQLHALQPMSARSHKLIATEKKGIVKFPLAISKRNHNEVKEKRNSLASKPYAMKRINTKTEKDMKQIVKENREYYK